MHLNLAAAGKCGNVESSHTFGLCKFCDKIAERGYASSIDAAVQMIPSEAQEYLCPARLHPVSVEKILHSTFTTNGGAERRASEPVRFDLQCSQEAVLK